MLRLFDGDRSLRKIAKELFVSLNTVKTHTQSIYRKLGVSDRKDAVSRGRELGLLSPARGPAGGHAGPVAPGSGGLRPVDPAASAISWYREWMPSLA